MRIQNVRSVTRAFSVIELMLVLVLVGILVAIALPRVTAYQQKVRVHQAVVDIATVSLLKERSGAKRLPGR